MKPGESCIACLPWLFVKQLYMPESSPLYTFFYIYVTTNYKLHHPRRCVNMSLGGAYGNIKLGVYTFLLDKDFYHSNNSISPTLILCLGSEVPTILASSIPPTILVRLVEHGLTALTGLLTLGLGRGFRFPRFGRLRLLRWFMSWCMRWLLCGTFGRFMCCIGSKCWFA